MKRTRPTTRPSLLDPSRRLVFATALHLEKRLLIGWVFRREEFPWLQTWLSYPGPNRMTRGLEFATQPFDLPRADVLKSGPLFDTPVFRIAAGEIEDPVQFSDVLHASARRLSESRRREDSKAAS